MNHAGEARGPGAARSEWVGIPDRKPVHVRMWGERGVPLLLVHGFMGDARAWGDLGERLAARFRVAAVDLPGHGRSAGGVDPGRYRVPDVARDLGRVQEEVLGGPAWWLGYSMGGRIALAAACEGVPIRGLLLESASPGIQDPEARRRRRGEDRRRAERLEAVGTDAFVDWWLGLPLFRGLERLPAPARAAARAVRASQDAGRMAAWLRGGGSGSQPSYWEALASLELPVHLLVGEADGKFREIAEAMRARLRGATLRQLPAVGHLPHLEAPDAWCDWAEVAVDEG
ncbi:MAG: 2-succinyl-6-hydroxy-2,4-cyclohexadiene-1-carboxylate synthase [Longimicrobiales bacterium]|nr:2-succinyl-6-hydroxy-2,4-cyclohexadiene-1-carboxylate synthase [Longimicrobiales bacterium]